MLKVTTFSKEISPALYFSTRSLYMRTGLEPVGRPRTKGCVGVGAKALILSLGELEMVVKGGVKLPTDDVVCDVGRGRCRIVSDNESHIAGIARVSISGSIIQEKCR